MFCNYENIIECIYVIRTFVYTSGKTEKKLYRISAAQQQVTLNIADRSCEKASSLQFQSATAQYISLSQKNGTVINATKGFCISQYEQQFIVTRLTSFGFTFLCQSYNFTFSCTSLNVTPLYKTKDALQHFLAAIQDSWNLPLPIA